MNVISRLSGAYKHHNSVVIVNSSKLLYVYRGSTKDHWPILGRPHFFCFTARFQASRRKLCKSFGRGVLVIFKGMGGHLRIHNTTNQSSWIARKGLWNLLQTVCGKTKAELQKMKFQDWSKVKKSWLGQ